MTQGLPILVWDQADAAIRARVLTRNGLNGDLSVDSELGRSIRVLLDDVRDNGDDALFRALRDFDQVDITMVTNRLVTDEDFAAARKALAPQVTKAIEVAVEHSMSFNAEVVRRATWSVAGASGTVGVLARPIENAGLFVPAGKGSFPSVMIQIGAPAVSAGVEQITVVVPPLPGSDGRADPATLVAADVLGLREVHCLNGPSGIAALAYGTEQVQQVVKIVGPGSPAVTLAQRLVQLDGCQIAPGLGPTDSAILADSAADPRLLAADLINEAEHGHDSSAILVSSDHELLTRVTHEAAHQLTQLPDQRQAYARSSLSNGGIILARDLDQAVHIVNDYASEHVQLAVADPGALASRIRYAGTLLLGQWTSFAASNYAIGTPATLPTTGYAKRTSGVTAHTFLNSISTAELTPDGFWTIADAIEDLAEHEGFPAHRASVTHRRSLYDHPRG